MTEAVGHRSYLNVPYVRSATPTRTEMTGLAGDEWGEVIDSVNGKKNSCITHTNTHARAAQMAAGHRTQVHTSGIQNTTGCTFSHSHTVWPNIWSLAGIHEQTLRKRYPFLMPFGQTTGRDQGRSGMERQGGGIGGRVDTNNQIKETICTINLQ